MNREVPLQFRPDRLADAHVAVIGVDPFHDRPGCGRPVGAGNDLFGGVDELVVVFVIAPVVVLDLITQHRICRERLEPLFLRIPAKVHPELQDQRAVVGQRVLEANDLRKPVVELRIVDFAINALQQRAGITTAQVHAHAALGRNVTPVTPESRSRLFLLRWRLITDSANPARIHPLIQHVHRGALASTIDAGKVDDDREARHFERLVLEFQQARAQPEFAFLEFSFRNALSEFCGIKQGALP